MVFLPTDDFYALVLVTILGFQVSIMYRLDEVEKELRKKTGGCGYSHKPGVVGVTPTGECGYSHKPGVVGVTPTKEVEKR